MAYSYAEIRSFQGLYLQQNSFQVPDGAMEEAKNVVIKSDEVVTKSNGFYQYWEASESHRLSYGDPKATVTFQGRLLLFSGSGVGYFEDTFPFGGTFNPVGSYQANDRQFTTYNVAMTHFQQNNNLYFTSEQSVRKLESYAGAASRAGVPPGLDLSYTLSSFDQFGEIKNTATGSQRAWRYVIGRRDTNGNLLLSAPSDILTFGMAAKATNLPYTITSGVVSFPFPDTYPVGLTIDDEIAIVDATNVALNGIQTNTDFIEDGLIKFNTGQPNGTGTLSAYIPGASIRLRLTLPSELEGVGYEYFVQVYRTPASQSDVFSPTPEFKLSQEIPITQDDFDTGYIEFTDKTPEALLGPELYTNPNTREGPLQENSRPPLCKYVGFYKNYAIYANITSVQRMSLNLANPETLTGVDLVFKSGFQQEIYRAVNESVYGPGNVLPRSATVIATNPLQFYLPNTTTLPVGSKALIFDIDSSGTIVPGEYEMIAYDSGTGLATFNCNGSSGFLKYQFVSDGTARLFNGYGSTYDSNGNIKDMTVAQWTAFVAQDLVRAINMNKDSFMYANYRSGFDELPGLLTIESKEFIEPIFLKLGSEPISPPFLQSIPTDFGTGIQFYSQNDLKPHWVYVSKVGEPEAVPTTNFIPVGSSSGEIVGIFTTRDSLIVLKEDGVYRIKGDIFETMYVEPLDLTISFSKRIPRVGDTINNTIVAFCNQGIVQITDTSVQLISRRIEDVIQPLIGRPLSQTFLLGHEADRLFYVMTENINAGQSRKCWVYNVVNQTWTESSRIFDHLALDNNNALTGIHINVGRSEYRLYKQRRTNTRIDYTGEWLFGSIETDTLLYPEKLQGVFTITDGNDVLPEPGDIIVAANIFNRITKVEKLGFDYLLTFAQPVSYQKDTPVNVFLYKGYESAVRLAPFHAGMVGRSKHFAQMQIHIRQQVITDLLLDFSGAYFNGSDTAEWKAMNIATTGASGWGFSPWGQFPWGLTDGANVKAGTESAAIIRTYVPRFAARNTFIQPRLRHSQAGQPMFIQALSWSIHGFGERVSK